jgi:LysM domain
MGEKAMPIEKAPKHPLPSNYVPPGGERYTVGNGDSWTSLAKRRGIDVGDLIEFNFKTRDPAEVNWYLRRNVGCRKTDDGRNWIFSADASPGFIYFPPAKKPIPVVKPAASAPCPEELNAAQATLEKSRKVAETILGPRATSDLPFWFARLYQYVTNYEIEERSKLNYPCFLLHFIPIFYDTYAAVVDAFKNNKGNIPDLWSAHFTFATSLPVDPSQLTTWMLAVNKSLVLAVTAHIRGDMAPSLEQAYRSYSAKYSSVPPFDAFKEDFFARNLPVFEKARLSLVNELVNRGTGLAMWGKSVDPTFASEAAKTIGMGLDTAEITKWREEAWRAAKQKLGQ